MELLLKNLKKLTESQLDEILELRDNHSFDFMWTELYQQLPGESESEIHEDLFIALSKATNGHEITSYIVDDQELIHRAKKANLSSDFLSSLIVSYERGEVPYTLMIKQDVI